MNAKSSLIHPLLTILAVTLIGWFLVPQSARADGSEKEIKAFMEPYGKIQAALADDDLSSAQAAAKALPLDKDAQAIAASTSLADARTAFLHISKKAIGMSASDESYHVFRCPMVQNGYWVQTSTQCANPFFGKSMLGCGRMLTKEEATKVSAPASAVPSTN